MRLPNNLQPKGRVHFKRDSNQEGKLKGKFPNLPGGEIARQEMEKLTEVVSQFEDSCRPPDPDSSKGPDTDPPSA